MRRIYLDHSATTPLRPEVLAAMTPYFIEHSGNASSLHMDGQRAKRALETARDRVAGILGAARSGAPHHHQCHRASRGAARLRMAGDAGL